MIESICLSTENNEELRAQWKRLLDKDCVKAHIGDVLREANEQVESIARADFISEDGRLDAIRTQARIAGLRRAIEILTKVEEEPDAARTTTI